MVNTKTQLTARQRARDASKAAIEREAKRVKVQTAYFESMDAVDKVYAQRDREIAAAEKKAEQAAAKSLSEADKQIRELLALKVSKAEAQERLGCTAGDVRRAIENADGGASRPSTDPEASAEGDVPAGEAVVVDAQAEDTIDHHDEGGDDEEKGAGEDDEHPDDEEAIGGGDDVEQADADGDVQPPVTTIGSPLPAYASA